ncbi:MAG: fumarylacetoacetate hydrolase family protein [Verrucomicrobiota bacterium]|nr:fumarylacetoacetate hydrolase family protein [Verrucomicrobiota bacterium]
MRLYLTESGPVIEEGKALFSLETELSWDELINRENLRSYLNGLRTSFQKYDSEDFLSTVRAPIGNQEVWAAGVTYFSSRLARMEESKDAGGGDFYSRVYGADRPEIFFKATPSRVVDPNAPFRIRSDSTWDVPEPELTLFASSSGTIEGYTIGNDVSSRSIEGENPLYLPQAKTFDQCACLGPCLYLPEEPLGDTTNIYMEIMRDGQEVFTGRTTLAEMKRQPKELINFLFRETSFADGVFLMTGTGIVPTSEFTLEAEDIVTISIDGIGKLTNPVASRK